jgi:hypothetical protein
MHCIYFNEISNEWVQEKILCINQHEYDRAIRIEELFRSKVLNGPRYFTPEEFAEILKFKGLAKSVPKFLGKYVGEDEVEEMTQSLFTNRLPELTFADTQNEEIRNEILRVINYLISRLQRLKFVGMGVASACVALCFPEFCGTADYIVPALLHNEHDHLNNLNPLFTNLMTAQRLRESLSMPLEHSLTASEARNIAFGNYGEYLRELWNIKQAFNLNNKVRNIEEAIWSFGICYVHKDNENTPLTFSGDPQPPRGGSFSKDCPNN